jgi:hypothetical protein
MKNGTRLALMKKSILFALLMGVSAMVFAREPADTAAIKLALQTIRDRDQKTRTGRDSAAFMQYIDSSNLVYIEKLIARYGWPGKSFVGPYGNQTVFLVIQHAETSRAGKIPAAHAKIRRGRRI